MTDNDLNETNAERIAGIRVRNTLRSPPGQLRNVQPGDQVAFTDIESGEFVPGPTGVVHEVGDNPRHGPSVRFVGDDAHHFVYDFDQVLVFELAAKADIDFLLSITSAPPAPDVAALVAEARTVQKAGTGLGWPGNTEPTGIWLLVKNLADALENGR